MMVDFCLRDLKMQKARLHFVFLAILIALSGHLEALAAEGGGKGTICFESSLDQQCTIFIATQVIPEIPSNSICSIIQFQTIAVRK
jgi:hypothetical protein